MKKPLVVRIVRSEWARGKTAMYDTGSSLLLRSGKKCCLGFACLALGATEENIYLKGTPRGIDVGVAIPTWLRMSGATTDVWRLIITNDSPRTSDAVKERRITRIFARHNLKAVFK